MPFIGLFSNNLGINLNSINSLLYYVLIIAFNYFYTTVFWDPEKISEQLRKASVSIVNITPGKETVSYLENVVRSTSILGGIYNCISANEGFVCSSAIIGGYSNDICLDTCNSVLSTLLPLVN